MLTQCPNCQTTFRVTAEILRVADGQVRCGRCQTQFDALARLLAEADDRDAQSGRFLRPARTQEDPPAPAIESPPSHEEITIEGEAIAESDLEAEEPPAHDAPVDEHAASAAEDHHDYYAAADDEQQDSEVVDPEIRTEDAHQSADEQSVQRPAEPAIAVQADEQHEDFADFDLGRKPAARSSLLWTLLAPLLLLLLLVQVVHHSRAALARHPRLGAPLLSLYDTLGVGLTPDWDLHAYTIQQWGVVSDPSRPGTLRVRASISNGAEFAQPYPLLKLVLEDRWGDQVRARVFEPSEYIDPASSPERLLAPGQKANATINIVDPGPDAEGFRFDVCLPGRQGAVCAEDLPGAG